MHGSVHVRMFIPNLAQGANRIEGLDIKLDFFKTFYIACDTSLGGNDNPWNAKSLTFSVFVEILDGEVPNILYDAGK